MLMAVSQGRPVRIEWKRTQKEAGYGRGGASHLNHVGSMVGMGTRDESGGERPTTDRRYELKRLHWSDDQAHSSSRKAEPARRRVRVQQNRMRPR
jgi:hypothetical protein